MISRTYFTETFYDMPLDVAQKYANVIRDAIVTGKPFEGEKRLGYFISLKRGFEDKLYVGNIHRIENHLYWHDEELQEDDQIINVVVIDGPITRDGDGCSYGSKDHRDQILYANTIPQVIGHLFIINTPGGASSSRIDYEQAIADCREKGKPTVAWVDGLCCSAGQLVASLCDRTIVMNGRHTMGCIGTMCAFWGISNGTVSQDGFRYIELVSVTSPDKNAEYREACDGKTEKLQAELDKLGDEFRETVRKNRPQVKEEHLTGKTFDAQDVMGALVDEIGDYSRAIQAVFDLADGTLKAARDVEVVEEDPNENPAGEEEGKPKDILTPNNDNNMTDEEIKAQEAEAANAAAKEETTAATEQPTEEANPTEAAEGGEQGAETAAAEGEGGEGTEASNGEGAGDEEPAEGEDGTGEEAPTEETPTEEAPANDAVAEMAQMQESLHAAETLVAERDKEIASLKEAIANLEGVTDERDAAVKERDAAITERDAAVKERDEHAATIEQLKKQNADLKAEVKELAGKPAPMTSEQGGVPADNGTGSAPQQKKRIKSGMTYEEIRAMQKGQ